MARAVTALAAVLLLAAGQACDDGEGGSGQEEAPSCSEVCEAFASLCGTAPPGCQSSCESAFTETERRCVGDATSCGGVEACFAAVADGDADSDTDADADTDVDGDADGDGPGTCARVGETCDEETPCEVWVCTCADGSEGRSPAACIDGLCDDTGLGADRTCGLYCLPEAATNARTDFGACE
jgi:hypothetical protein